MWRRAAGPALLGASLLGMLAWTWGQWPDVLIDFGRELYVPWQLSQGKVLYRDIAHLSGPLSQYVNALLFRIFGPGIWALAAFNLLLMAALVRMLHDLLARMAASRFAATAGCLVFVALFGFAQFSRIGNYNYLCPYSHELTHGLVLSVAGILLLARHRRLGPRALGGAGFCLGLLALTKTEALLGGGAAIVTGTAATLVLERPPKRRLGASLAVFVACALLPLVSAFALLWLAMPAAEAAKGVSSTVLHATRGSVRALRFYREGMGTDAPGEGLLAMLGWTGRYLLVLVPPALLALLLRKPGLRKPWWAAAVGLPIPLALGVGWHRIDWPHAARPLPLVAVAVAVVSLALLARRRADPRAGDRLVLWLTTSVLAIGLLAKMLLNARIHHYGFVLAMPAALLLVAVLVEIVPGLIEKRGGYGPAFRLSSVALLGVVVFAHLAIMANVLGMKKTVVASGRDRFVADRRGEYVNRIVRRVREAGLTGKTLAVMPEGVILNYLLRMENPTPHIKFLPLELTVFGEGEALRALEANPPDLVALVHVDTSDEGFPFFGRDYGQTIFRWVRANYRPLFLEGSPPLRDGRFGIAVLEHTAVAAPAPD